VSAFILIVTNAYLPRPRNVNETPSTIPIKHEETGVGIRFAQ
jgi:hypothetical protein